MKSVGRSVPGLPNRVLVSGHGTFVADVALPGMCAMAVLRSPYAHARIVSLDTSRALAEPGVVYVLTGEEIERETAPVPPAADPKFYGGKGLAVRALSADRVRYAGEPVAVVVAEDRYTANRVLELIDVVYEELPVVSDCEAALEPGSPLVEPSWTDNVMIQKEFTQGDAAGALRAAGPRVVRGVVKAQRYVAAPIEPRAYAADWDPYANLLTVWSSTQNPHPLRVFLAETLGMPETSIRVIQPHVGGGFGQKVPTFAEEVVHRLPEPQARAPDQMDRGAHRALPRRRARARGTHHLRGGIPAGRPRDALDVRIVADVGVPATFCGWAMSYVTAYCVPAAYKIPDCRVEVFTVVTNKCPWNGYRAFGKEAASFLMDRVMDRVADATGVDRVEVRLANFIQPDEFPFSQVSGAMLDSGDYPRAMRRVRELIDADGFAREQQEALRHGRRIGLGFGFELTPEGCSLPNSTLLSGYDGATVRVAPSGQVTVLTGVTSPGSGNETGIAQIVADELGVPIGELRVLQGDTDTCPYGLGNYSSRSLMIGGSAAKLAATELREKMFKVAAKALEVTPADLDADDGQIFVVGAPTRRIAFRDVASLVYRHAYGAEASDVEPGLEATRYFRIGNVYHQPEVQGRFSAYPTWPSGASAAVVEVDADTGFVKVLRYVVVHDSGPIVNPILAHGNLIGGIAQGLGGALYEHMVYDDAAQLMTSSFMDYTVPTAVEIPSCVIEMQETASPFTLTGCKGVGESGVTSPLGAVASAVENAFPELRLALMETPLMPNRVWRALREAQPRG